MLKCISGCKFGIGGQNSYAEKFVKYANMFALMLDESPPKDPGDDPEGPAPKKTPGGMRFSSDGLSAAGSSLATVVLFAGLAYSAFRTAHALLAPPIPQ